MDSQLIVYGHQYCADVFYLISTLDRLAIPYEWRDVAEGSLRFQQELRLLARGNLSVPTVVFLDGSVMVEPNPREVLAKLDQEAPGSQA